MIVENIHNWGGSFNIGCPYPSGNACWRAIDSNGDDVEIVEKDALKYLNSDLSSRDNAFFSELASHEIYFLRVKLRIRFMSSVCTIMCTHRIFITEQNLKS